MSWPGGGDFGQKNLPGGRRRGNFYAKNCLNMQFFSKNRLFYEKFVPGGVEFGKNIGPGVGNFAKIFGPGSSVGLREEVSFLGRTAATVPPNPTDPIRARHSVT